MSKAKSITLICIFALLTLVFGGLYFASDLELENRAAQIETLTAADAEKAAQIETLTADVAEKAAQIETLTADVADKAAQIETLTAADAEKAAQIETLTAADAEKAAQIETLSAADADKAAQIETLTADAAEKTAQIETLTAADAEKAAQIETLTAADAEKAAQIETLTAQLPPPEDLSLISQGEHASTKRLINLLLRENLYYYIYPATEDDPTEIIQIPLTNYSDSYWNFSYNLHVYLEPENDVASFYAWDLIQIDPSRLQEAKELCYTLTASWKWLSFNISSYNNTIYATYDLPLLNNASDELLMQNAIGHIHDIISYTYDDLRNFQE